MKRYFKITLKTGNPNYYYYTFLTAPTRRMAIIMAKLQAKTKGHKNLKTYLVHEV